MAQREVTPTTRGNFGQMLKYLIDQDIKPTDSDLREPWSQERLATSLGLESRAQIGRWVRGNNIPPKERFDRMIELFFGNSSNRHADLKDLFLKKYRRALDSQRKYGDSTFFSQSSTLLFWDGLEKKCNTNFDTCDIQIKAKKIEEICWLLENKLLSWHRDRILQTVRDTRAYVFDVKYGDIQADEDERHMLGIDEWNEEFSNLLEEVGVDFSSKLVNVGLGPGLEGKGIYERFPEFVGVDLSLTALNSAKKLSQT